MPDILEDDPDEVVRRVERAIDSIHFAIQDIRNLIFGLRPELLGGTTLMVGLAAIIEEFRHNSVIDVELRTSGFDREPSPDATAHLLGIVNEALSNIARHSGASQAFVEVDVDDDGSFHIAVTDNGHGFDAASIGALGHQGLANMRSRAVEIGAMITFESGPGGTSVQVTLPPGPDHEHAGAATHD